MFYAAVLTNVPVEDEPEFRRLPASVVKNCCNSVVAPLELLDEPVAVEPSADKRFSKSVVSALIPDDVALVEPVVLASDVLASVLELLELDDRDCARLEIAEASPPPYPCCGGGGGGGAEALTVPAVPEPVAKLSAATALFVPPAPDVAAAAETALVVSLPLGGGPPAPPCCPAAWNNAPRNCCIAAETEPLEEEDVPDAASVDDATLLPSIELVLAVLDEVTPSCARAAAIACASELVLLVELAEFVEESDVSPRYALTRLAFQVSVSALVPDKAEMDMCRSVK